MPEGCHKIKKAELYLIVVKHNVDVFAIMEVTYVTDV